MREIIIWAGEVFIVLFLLFLLFGSRRGIGMQGWEQQQLEREVKAVLIILSIAFGCVGGIIGYLLKGYLG